VKSYISYGQVRRFDDSVDSMHQVNSKIELKVEKQHRPAEETLSQLLAGEQRTHHAYWCHLQLMFCKSNLLAVCLQYLIQQVDTDP
jgi:hypothetical protein